MSFDKAAYWRQKNAHKAFGLEPGQGALVVCCRRCSSTKGTLLSASNNFGDFFVCANRCDQRSFGARLKYFFGLGAWRLVYSDGQVSRPMSARSAKNYAVAFSNSVAAVIATKKPIVDLALK